MTHKLKLIYIYMQHYQTKESQDLQTICSYITSILPSPPLRVGQLFGSFTRRAPFFFLADFFF